MFEITPSNEFATWFEALAPELAEEVACALDLLAEAGVALGPSRTSRALLWYDGCGGGAPTDAWYGLRAGGDAPRAFDDVREVLLWHREIVRCLDSTAFRERLARLQPQAASLALAAVENLKVRLKGARARSTLHSSTALFPRSALATLATLTPLFGLDAPGQRIVALVGEPLTRSYYGDSVQLAEQRWLSYCSSPAQPPVQARDR